MTLYKCLDCLTEVSECNFLITEKVCIKCYMKLDNTPPDPTPEGVPCVDCGYYFPKSRTLTIFNSTTLRGETRCSLCGVSYAEGCINKLLRLKEDYRRLK